MKKFLSLVLALAMTFALVTVSAGATDFTDDSKVTYTEAVDVISACGIINGYTDGSFAPTNTLTRGAAAKIICNMILGPTTASALGADTAPFKDVPVNHTFAGYIAYCAQAGIINGYADGSFKPAGTVTGYQFMKMLLGALGYDGSVEGFTGSNWTVAVAKLASSLSLTKGNDSFIGSNAMTREEACLYAFNTMLATLVEYDTAGTSITVGDTTISTGASKAESVYSSDSAARYIKQGTANSDGQYTLQFAEKYFTKLKLVDDSEDGIGGRHFTYDSKQVSDYAATDDVLATVYGGTAYASLTTKSNSKYIGYEANTYNGAASVSYYKNGAAVTDSGAIDTLKALIASNGIITKFVDNDDDGYYDVVSVVEKKVAKLTAAPKVTTSGSVTSVTIGACAINSEDADNVSYPDGLAKNDYVLYYQSADSGVYHVEKAASFTGTLTAYTGSKVVIDGTTYKLSALKKGGITVADDNILANTSSLSGTTFYTDNAGYICGYETASDSVNLTNTLFIVSAGYSESYTGSGSYTYKADAVMMDGTTATITVDKTAVNGGVLTDAKDGASFVDSSMEAGHLTANAFYTYAKNSDGTYNLTAVAAANETSVNPVAKGLVNIGGGVATSDTVYVYKNSTKSSYTVYSGVANAPEYTGTVYVLKNSSGYVLACVAGTGTIENTDVSDYDIAFITSAATVYYESNQDVDHCEYEAVVNGTVTTVTATAAMDSLTAGSVVLVNSYDSAEIAGVVTIGSAEYNTLVNTALTPATDTTFSIVVTGTTMDVQTIDSTGVTTSHNAFLLASDATCFVWDNDDSTATKLDSAADLAALSDIVKISTVKVSESNSNLQYVFVEVD